MWPMPFRTQNAKDAFHSLRPLFVVGLLAPPALTQEFRKQKPELLRTYEMCHCIHCKNIRHITQALGLSKLKLKPEILAWF